ncbi:putative cysteine desulfurase [Pseudoalteromonas sp. CIP111854]|uniref:Cysteine desulfurase n=1 Tax=Pseudoalteromonas holothuriae TaxID=2963714 RepID=A0A9W4QS45_9GAMM|nr:aminotransferase class V-fold PLP-dependent enzyme [Pseudoalteromonas sp. CIP111854]CAH9050767.1 putative cysteine desulfurase [Pseudoalteromonas sp. CIP111854]
MSFNCFKKAFIGTDFMCANAQGKNLPRTYLDSAASTLALLPAQQATQAFLKYYSNTHSSVHLSAKVSSGVVTWAHQSILSFFGAEQGYSAIFHGNGATSPLNRLAKGLSELRRDKKTVLVSLMEHHSNDLPHRAHGNKVIHINIYDSDGEFQGIDLKKIELLCQQHQQQLNYIAVTAASNVSGHISPIYDIAEIAHKYGAYIVVDGAQLAAHAPIELAQENPQRSIDFFVFSGHKTYAPGSPGVLIGKTQLLSQLKPEFYGGGMVAQVSKFDFTLSEQVFDKEHAGTLNIPGIFMLATTLEFLRQIGMPVIYQKECMLTQYLINTLKQLDDIKVYADSVKTQRIGAVSFNIRGLPHELLALILNDYFAIAVRNDCFCAHPFVRECLVDELWDIEDEDQLPLYQGMVRASIGLYSNKGDIDTLSEALSTIIKQKAYYMAQYKRTKDNHFVHKTFKQDTQSYFNINQTLSSYFNDYLTEVGVVLPTQHEAMV